MTKKRQPKLSAKRQPKVSELSKKAQEEFCTKLFPQLWRDGVTYVTMLENYALNIKQRGRGRPGQARLVIKSASVHVPALPEHDPSEDDRKALANRFRAFLADKPKLADQQGTLAECLNATAAAIEAGDSYGTGHYALAAMCQTILSTVFATLNADDGSETSLISLASAGNRKQKADKKRAKSVKMARHLRG